MFVTLGLAQLGLALALRAPRARGSLAHRGLEVAVAGAAALQVLAVAWPPLRGLLGTEPLPPIGIVAVLALSAVPGVLALRRSATR